jgi:hypothetical protein
VQDKDEDVEWTRPEDLFPYKGIFKVFIIAPDDLYLPVVAEKFNGKLVSFHLYTLNNSHIDFSPMPSMCPAGIL